ncbi:hypothetical protein ES705_49309 [subsurface metagenome]
MEGRRLVGLLDWLANFGAGLGRGDAKYYQIWHVVSRSRYLPQGDGDAVASWHRHVPLRHCSNSHWLRFHEEESPPLHPRLSHHLLVSCPGRGHSPPDPNQILGNSLRPVGTGFWPHHQQFLRRPQVAESRRHD